MNRKQALVWFTACAISVLDLAYQLNGGVRYVHSDALEAMLGIDGLLLLVIIFYPPDNSLFSKVRGNDRDFQMITLLIFLSTLLMINGLLDFEPSNDGSGLVAGIWVVPGRGVTTLMGILFLLIAMIALSLLLVTEFLSGGRIRGDKQQRF